ncbi:hypothetical protein IEO21_10112 [Rhodonia placenta]|uniref:AB hydrolase-1 domain-containing protein n=1 Tax=Rhodonia placenta TaxID=104341 RepID=A0A8H7NT16_9APHY|nr:hypothetical protein IEO21_10112 [Postia placenta]
MPSIIVDDKGTVLNYIDSGVPHNPVSSTSYVTIFIVHGSVYTAPVFQKVMALAANYGLRIVGINRRDYPGSTPFSHSELAVLSGGSDDERADFVRARGLEIATFVDRFIENQGVPPISEDGKSGGIALLGWSLGSAFVLSTISCCDTWPTELQSRLKTHLRALILQSKAWSPQIDTTIQESDRDPLFTQWITSYFHHGDLSKRDPNLLTYVVPATFRAPSVFTMSDEQIAEIVYQPPASTSDMLFMIRFSEQLLASHRKACFYENLRQLVPRMKIWALTGDSTASFSLPAFWALQEEDEAVGGGRINFKIVKGVNHFMHWDEPELTIQTYLEALA